MDKIFVDEAIADLHTINDMLRWAVSRFLAANIWYGHGTDNPWDEAIQLVLPTLWLPLNIPEDMFYTRLATSERSLIVERVIRRVKERIPVAYLTNKSWFCGHEFYIDQRVLIPRSSIGELIKNKFTGIINEYPYHILDMCTGSGCIAISCAYAFPKAKIDAVDISSDALAVAKKNVEDHDLLDHVNLIKADLFRNLPPIKYNLIVTNPPYVDVKDISNLPSEYRYEPELALVAGSEGLKIVHRILACAPNYLDDKGILICEVGNNMNHMIELYPDISFTWLDFENGNKGVFMLTREQIIKIHHHFHFYKD